MDPLEAKVDIAALRYQQGIAQCFRHLPEQLCHFMRGAQVVRAIRHAHPVWVTQQRIGLDGQQDILQPPVFGIDVMHIIGCDVFGGITRSQLDQLAVHLGDLFEIVLLQLDEEAVRSEHVVIPVRTPDSFSLVAFR